MMLLGQVAIALRQEHGIIGSVVGIFKQRMFYPTSNLDISMVNELAKMAAKTGVSVCVCVCVYAKIGISMSTVF